MVINGLRITPREIGQIRLGKVEEGKNHPTRLKWFEVLRGGEEGKFIYDKEAHAAIGARPTAIQVFLPHDEIDQVFHYELALYQAKGRPRYCWGDRETATMRMFPGDMLQIAGPNVVMHRLAGQGFKSDPPREAKFDLARLDEDERLSRVEKDGKVGYRALALVDQIGPVACDCPFLDRNGDESPPCKPHAILSVMLAAKPTLGAVYKFRTTSWNSIQGIIAGLTQIRDLFGTLMGVPLWLVCKEIESTDSGTGKKRKIVVAHIEFRNELEKGLEAHRRFLDLRGPVRQVAPAGLLEAGLDRPDVAEEIVAEFHPDLDVEAPADTAPDPAAPEIPPDPTEPEPPPPADLAATCEHGFVGPCLECAPPPKQPAAPKAAPLFPDFSL